MDNTTLIERLRPYVTEERFALLNANLSHRTRYMTCVLENVHHAHNASAVLRTCECFGIQDVSIISNTNDFVISKNIEHGSAQWLTVNMFQNQTDNTPLAIDTLKGKGYRIVATTPHGGGVGLHDFDVTRGPFAIVVGSERKGVSPYTIAHADEFLTIPMVGFTESLNLSVSAAIIISHLSQKMAQMKVNAGLCDAEKNELLVKWLLASIRNADFVHRRILSGE